MTTETLTRAVAGIRNAIAAFRDDRLPVDRLSWELKNHLSQLDGVADEAWVDELRGFRNQVEYVSAFWIESGREQLTDEERRDVELTLSELEAALTVY